MQEVSIRDFKYCIHKLKIITDDTCDGYTSGKAIHNLALYLNQTYNDGYLRMADIAMEAKAKRLHP